MVEMVLPRISNASGMMPPNLVWEFGLAREESGSFTNPGAGSSCQEQPLNTLYMAPEIILPREKPTKKLEMIQIDDLNYLRARL
jgi:hypothetical protein